MDLGQGEVGCGEVESFSLPQSKEANAAVETQVRTVESSDAGEGYHTHWNQCILISCPTGDQIKIADR